jgi:hypothetical protein
MRWSAGVFVALVGLILVVGAGCRKVPTENNDRNRPPDTYLSAAPIDSIANGGLSRVPHRFVPSGPDRTSTGKSSGSSSPSPRRRWTIANGRPYRLPAPRPSQYRFTTARESLFTFEVLEGRGTDREHALYVFSVDNQGKVDPTPAVTHFIARDPHLPGLTWTDAHATGTIYLSNGVGGVTPTPFYRDLTDGHELPQHVPIDTIPSGGNVFFRLVAGSTPDFGASISGYLYKMTEIDFVRADSTVLSSAYGRHPEPRTPADRLSVFRVRSIDEAGGTTQPASLRRVFVNFSPDTWLSGRTRTTRSLPASGHLFTDSLGTYFETYQDVANWGRAVDFPGNPLTDTLDMLPAERPVTDGSTAGSRRSWSSARSSTTRCGTTFGAENDTIAFGSLLIARFGGADKDSPYRVRGGDPDSVSRLYRSGPAKAPRSPSRRGLVTCVRAGRIRGAPFSTPFPKRRPARRTGQSDRALHRRPGRHNGPLPAVPRRRRRPHGRHSDRRTSCCDTERFDITNEPPALEDLHLLHELQAGDRVARSGAGQRAETRRATASPCRCARPTRTRNPSNPRRAGRTAPSTSASVPGSTRRPTIRVRSRAGRIRSGASTSPSRGELFPYTSPISLDIVVPGDFPGTGDARDRGRRQR